MATVQARKATPVNSGAARCSSSLGSSNVNVDVKEPVAVIDQRDWLPVFREPIYASHE